MAIMILSETIEGQTAKIVQFIESLLHKDDHEVRLVDTANRLAKVSYKNIDKVILAAPVHERRHPRSFEVFVAADHAALEARETLMLSISLKAAFAKGESEAKEFLAEMEQRTGFSARQKALVAGAVRPGGYDYFSSQFLRHAILAEKYGHLADSDHEFTDWAALEATVAAFLDS